VCCGIEILPQRKGGTQKIQEKINTVNTAFVKVVKTLNVRPASGEWNDAHLCDALNGVGM